jgi:transcriptional regulator of nitric oxide reductase/ferredoxin
MRLLALLLLLPTLLWAETVPREEIAERIRPPYSLGEDTGEGVYRLLNSGGAHAGYAFETEPMAPLPGFAGAPVNVLVVLDLEGRFLDVQLLNHNEPIFVSGLGPAPFHAFFEQYEGRSISDALVVGSPYGAAGEGSGQVRLDGVTKATASVRIAHESILAAALQVARERMQGVAAAPPAHPDPDHEEDLTWDDLVAQGLASRLTVTNAEVDALFAGTIWAHDDPEAKASPEEPFLDLWVVDVGPPSIARAALDPGTLDELRGFLEISPTEEPILLIEAGRHGLVSEEFVRNTAPDRIAASQDGLPIALRDSDLFVTPADGAPDGTAMIVRTDRRLGFDPTRPWTLEALAVREHGMLQPQIGSVPLTVEHVTPERFYLRPGVVEPTPPWLDAIQARRWDLAALGLGLVALFVAMGPLMRRVALPRLLTPVRLGALAVMTAFVGYWGQGQLTIATVLGVVRTAVEGGSFVFLLYDPFGLAIWGAAILGLVLWGRALFCGWLCPFGALQEFAHHLGRLLRLPQIEPSARWDARLKWGKYGVLGALVGVALLAPAQVDKAVEVEPFKTAITVYFLREWWWAAYAIAWILLGLVLFKGFCRYVCPLGAFMAIGGLIRGRAWIARREECGSPCQLCRVQCRYGAIEKSGRIDYSECFGCLDCVSIHDDPSRCVPLVLRDKRGARLPVAAE